MAFLLHSSRLKSLITHGATNIMNFENYQVESFYDELFEKSGAPREMVAPLIARLKAMPPGDLKRQQKAAEAELLQMGITFTVYGNQEGTEKILPFDIIPRVIPASEWKQIESGLTQRIQALNLFIDDIYHDQKILKDKIIPADMVKTSFGFRSQCLGLNPPRRIWIHITGTDLVRDADGKFYVLEDNLRCPSGVSYVLENRSVLKRTLPHVFQSMPVRTVDEYSHRLLDTLEFLAPPRPGIPGWWCSRPALTTRLISSTPFWPNRWARSWSRAAIFRSWMDTW